MDFLEILNRIEGFYLNYGYVTAFLASLIEISPFGWTIPGGVILAAGGFFAFDGGISFLGIILSGWLGAWATFLLSYFLGKKSGNYLITKFRQEKNAAYAKNLLQKHGGVILSTSMMANITRFWVAYVAGMQGYNFFRFLFYSSGAALAWASLMAVAGFIAGSGRTSLEKGIASLGILAWGLAGLAIFVIVRKSKQEFKESKKPNGNN